MNKVVEEIGKMNFQGNTLVNSWFHSIKAESGKPDIVAIVLLSEIIYWYRPTIERDESTGKVIGLKQKFKADKLQKSYDQLAKQFGFSKTQVRRAIKRLEEKGIITIEYRNISTHTGLKLSNVMYIEPVPEKIEEITFINMYSTNSENINKVDTYGQKSTEGVDKKVHTNIQKSTEGIDKKVDTYTENTTEITTKNNTEEYILSPSSISDDETYQLNEKEKDKDTNRIEKVPYQKIVDLYNDICVSMPSVKTITSKRKEKMKVLYREVRDLEVIEECFRKAEKSSFLNGSSGKWSGCNFDWLVNYNNFIKVLEGTYDDKEVVKKRKEIDYEAAARNSKYGF